MKDAVYGPQQFLLFQSHGALNLQVGLEIGHEQGSGDSLSCHIARDDSVLSATQFEKIVIISADLPRLDTRTEVFERLNRRWNLREEPRLNLLRDLEFL